MARPPRGLRILIVDDQRLLAESLSLALRLEGFDPVVASVADRDDLVRQLREDPPAVVLLDLDLGGELGDGATLVAPCVAAGARVVVMTGTKDRLWATSALEQGASAVLDKGIASEELLETVMSVARGEPVLATAERDLLLRELRHHRTTQARDLAPFETLSPREQEVLRALAVGLTVPRIAERRVVSEATVRSQVHAILSKLDVRSQLEAVAAARRVGWL
jgi:DNA-binding NarL/FixJ family response regulator